MEEKQIKSGERIAKRLARAGVCSRRDAERWIEQGRVQLNGQVLQSPAVNVSDDDVIVVDGEPLSGKEPTRMWLYHKPAGLVTSHRDEQGRETIFETLPQSMPRVISVGRLDLNSEGLLLLTNDGALSRYLEMPSTGWVRQYRVRAHGRITQANLDILKEGISVEGVHYGAIEAVLEKEQHGSNVWMQISLREGKNREIRRVLDDMGLSVNRLIRQSYGAFELGNLKVGEVMEVPADVLHQALGAFFCEQK
jgi:23S rRNA pseudouridine2605 synthase